MDKKGIELSMNFLVIIIITIVVFSFGVYFINKLFFDAGGIRDMTIDELDDRISSLACEDSSRVCIGQDTKPINRGEFDFFGVKIVNTDTDRDFQIIVAPASPIGYGTNNLPLSGSGLIIKPEGTRYVKVDPDSEETFAIGVEVPENAPSGKYIINVNVKHKGADYTPMHKIYVNVP